MAHNIYISMDDDYNLYYIYYANYYDIYRKNI